MSHSCLLYVLFGGACGCQNVICTFTSGSDLSQNSVITQPPEITGRRFGSNFLRCEHNELLVGNSAMLFYVHDCFHLPFIQSHLCKMFLCEDILAHRQGETPRIGLKLRIGKTLQFIEQRIEGVIQII